MRPWNNPRWATAGPLAATACIEAANVGQLWRMLTEHTAAGQSLGSWLMVSVGLALYWNFYRVCTPTQLLVRRIAAFGVCTNLTVALTVAYFRYCA